MIQYPEISSFASVKGPSTTVRFPRENLMRAPLELGCSPARSRSTPAFSSSSLYFPIADKSSSLGILPASESVFAFTIIMNRIHATPRFWSRTSFRRVHPAEPPTTLTSNESHSNRHRIFEERLTSELGLCSSFRPARPLERE